MAYRNHLFPFRTEKLRLYAPMVLRKWKSRFCQEGLRLKLIDYAICEFHRVIIL